MGDPRRFDLFAALIAQQGFPTTTAIADVAGGKGYLQAALRQRGYTAITSWDTRHKMAKNRRGYRYGWFDHRTAPPGYDLVVGMHPDEGTDQILCYATTHRVPFLVCPCCVKPSARVYWGSHDYASWVKHLVGLAEDEGFAVEVANLKMDGRNGVLIGRLGRVR